MTIGAFTLLRSNRRFRWFWLGCTVSVMGDAFTKVAFTWFVYERTGSPSAVALLMVCYMGPLVIGGFGAGWALDRFERFRVMMADSVARGLVIGLVPLLYLFGVLEVWHVYAAAAVYGLLMMVALAGAPSLIPALVAQHELNAANSLETLSYTIGGIAGPALAGLLIARIGAPLTVLVDVASYLAFAVVLSRLRSDGAARQPSAAVASSGYGATFRILAGTPVLLSTTLMFCVFNLGEGAMNVWLPVLSGTVLMGGPGLYGLLLGILALGETVGALYAGSRTGGRLGLGICVAQLLSGLAVLVIVLTPSLPAAAIGLFLLGAFSAPMTVWAQTLRMQILPPELHGRAFALLRLMMQAGNPLGAALSGALFPVLGLLGLIAASAAVMGLPGAIGLGVRGLRQAAARTL
ncbi:MAG: MFS transporter [Rhodospirillaceae bacterium]|nr:MFS transporter [Rhodospirillaceae bacterium]